MANHKENFCSQRCVECEYCSAVMKFCELQVCSFSHSLSLNSIVYCILTEKSHMDSECQQIPVDCLQCSNRMPRHLVCTSLFTVLGIIIKCCCSFHLTVQPTALATVLIPKFLAFILKLVVRQKWVILLTFSVSFDVLFSAFGNPWAFMCRTA